MIATATPHRLLSMFDVFRGWTTFGTLTHAGRAVHLIQAVENPEWFTLNREVTVHLSTLKCGYFESAHEAFLRIQAVEYWKGGAK